MKSGEPLGGEFASKWAISCKLQSIGILQYYEYFPTKFLADAIPWSRPLAVVETQRALNT
jgi:hypothetical protein